MRASALFACCTAALCAASLAAPAQAEECGPLLKLASLEMTALPEAAGVTVPILVNGVTQHLLLATAGGASSLTRATGDALMLRPHYIEATKLLDDDGYAGAFYFNLASLKIGVLEAADTALMVTPNPKLGADPPFDGLLVADLMEHYDIEMDFAQRTLNYFSQEHCPGHVVYWPAAAIGTAPIALDRRADDLARGGAITHHSIDLPDYLQDFTPPVLGIDIRTSVELDGKRFTANIDTSAETSTLNTATAKIAYAVTADSPGSSPPGTAQGEAPKKITAGVETVIVHGTRVFEHTFHTLTFGGVTVTNPLFTVRPDITGTRDPGNDYQTGTRVARVDDFPRPEITIGMNVLRKLHLYFAFREGTLYITPATMSAGPPP